MAHYPTERREAVVRRMLTEAISIVALSREDRHCPMDALPLARMTIWVIDVGILLYGFLLLYGFFSKRCFALIRWYHYEENKSMYWQI